MAEAIAAVALVSSIGSLIDLSAKVVSRLHEFTSKTSDIPDWINSLSTRLPLLTATLQRIKTQADAGSLSRDATKALKAVIDNTAEQVSTIQRLLSRVLPLDGAAKFKQVVKALKSLTKEDKVQQAVEKIHKNIDVLLLHQTTQNVDTGDLMLAQLSELTLTSKAVAGSFGKDELLSLARDVGKQVLQGLPTQTQSMLSNNSGELLFRFSQLPIAAQEKFIVQQEEQLRQFVEKEEAKLIEFLTDFDTRDRLADAGKRRLAGSCDWVLESHSYRSWVQGTCNQLWLEGEPGTGKTVASAFITEALNDQLEDRDVLAVYTCNFSESKPTPATSIMCALAGQIAHSSPASMDKCKKFLERHLREDQQSFEAQDLQDLIVEVSLSADIQRIFIIIDELDAGDWKQLDHLTAVVDIPRYARKVKMLVTSRPDPRIAKVLDDYSCLPLTNQSLLTALASFIDRKLKGSKLASMPQNELDEIRETVMSNSNGIFFLARLIIEALSNTYHEAANSTSTFTFNPYLTAANSTFTWAKDLLLYSVPRSLYQFYTMKMVSIGAINSPDEAFATVTYLRVLAKCPEKKTPAELYEIAVVSFPDLPLYTPEEVVARAQGLLDFNPKTAHLRFIHETAREYLQTDRLLKKNLQANIVHIYQYVGVGLGFNLSKAQDEESEDESEDGGTANGRRY